MGSCLATKHYILGHGKGVQNKTMMKGGSPASKGVIREIHGPTIKEMQKVMYTYTSMKPPLSLSIYSF